MSITRADNQTIGNYMKGVGRSEITAEYNKNLRYIDIRPMITFLPTDRS